MGYVKYQHIKTIIGYRWFHNLPEDWFKTWEEALEPIKESPVLFLEGVPKNLEDYMNTVDAETITGDKLLAKFKENGSFLNIVSRESIAQLLKQKPRPTILYLDKNKFESSISREVYMLTTIILRLKEYDKPDQNIGYIVGNYHTEAFKMVLESLTNINVVLRPAGHLPENLIPLSKKIKDPERITVLKREVTTALKNPQKEPCYHQESQDIL